MRQLALSLLVALLLTFPARAQETEVVYLSGTGSDDTVDWEFFCTGGRKSGRWTTIPVPSQWELQGFGTYNYGHDKRKSDEEGRYRHRFRLPEGWRGRTVDLVFEGVMTDADVRVNGETAGPVHQGAFYRFRHDVTALLGFDGENLLEVDVRKKSADASVNRAERDADYWVFGGIFRPVYLEASPPESIGHVAIDARADGAFRLRARLRGLAEPPGRTTELHGRILTAGGREAGPPFAGTVDGETVELETRVEDPRAWSAETPHLYRLRLELRRGARLLHRRTERFGFRTVEVIRPFGLYVNGRKVRLKGVNRHAFHPDSGRTLNRRLDRRDAALIKAMNLNAVRTAHYPPDVAFLEACDELGLYVLDELAGWHDAYDTAVGRRLIREMVERDHNHPSILFWDNGNEGGWNSALDRVFGEHDLQGRRVLRPNVAASGIDTEHYLTWEELLASLDASWPFYKRWLYGEAPLVMPTELLHGLYDGGSGAGLGEYWRRIRDAGRGAGAFLWAFTDEAVVRTDRHGALDTDGNHAPDGILGPYREISGNFHAVREVFSPVEVIDEALPYRFGGRIRLRNRYDMSDLSSVRFKWSQHALPRPGDLGLSLLDLESEGESNGPETHPGGEGWLDVGAVTGSGYLLRLSAFEPSGREIMTWTLPQGSRRSAAAAFVDRGAGTVAASEAGDVLTLRAPSGAAAASFDSRTGKLLELVGEGARLELAGPLLSPPAPISGARIRHWAERDGHVVEARFEKGFEYLRWKLFPSGWLRMTYQFEAHGKRDYFGIAFPLAAEKIKSFEWLGRGPARVWKNRRQGGTIDVWRKKRSKEPGVEWAHEPKLAGFYGGVYWAKLRTVDGLLTLVLAEDDLDLGIPEIRFPEDSKEATAAVPSGLAVLNGISAIGTKFHPADELGPQGRPYELEGSYRGTVWLYPGRPEP